MQISKNPKKKSRSDLPLGTFQKPHFDRIGRLKIIDEHQDCRNLVFVASVLIKRSLALKSHLNPVRRNPARCKSYKMTKIIKSNHENEIDFPEIPQDNLCELEFALLAFNLQVGLTVAMYFEIFVVNY